MKQTLGQGVVCFLLMLLSFLSDASNLGERTLRFEPVLQQDSINGGEGIGKVRSIIEDSSGFMWFAGEKGLARFDGQFWRIFRASDKLGLPSSYTTDLIVDLDGILWVATSEGLVFFDKDTLTFKPPRLDNTAHQDLSLKTITSLAVDRLNHLVVGSLEGMLLINPDRSQASHYQHTGGVDGLSSNFVRHLLIDKKNRIWIATDANGVNIFDRSNETFQYILQDLQQDPTLVDNRIRSMVEDDRGHIWVGTYRGVSLINEQGRILRNIQYELDAGNDNNKSVAWDLLQDQGNTIWMAVSKGGLAFYNTQTGLFEPMNDSRGNAVGFDASSSLALYEDSRGDVWVSQFPVGIVCYKRVTDVFKNFTSQNRSGLSLSNNGILSLLPKDAQTLWVGTEQGLNLFQMDKKQFLDLPFPAFVHDQIAGDTILDMVYDKAGQLWMGTWSEGIKVWDANKNHLKIYNSENTALKGNSAWQLLLDRTGQIWVGMEGAGTFRYDTATQDFVSIEQSVDPPAYRKILDTRALYEDQSGQIWVGGYGGLDFFDTATQRFKRFPMDVNDPDALHAPQVSSIAEDVWGRLWVGTHNHGINVLSKDRQSVLHITKAQRLPSNRVTSITFDQKGQAWAGTTFGVARIDTQTLDVTPYNRAHGLVSNNFYRDASFVDRKGYVYFGSAEGLSVWHPNELDRHVNPARAQVVEMEIRYRNQGQISLPGIMERTYISVPADHSSFRLRFSSLDYRPANLVQFEYRLLGFDDTWRHAGRINQTTYTNLNAGYYVFQVRARDEQGHWVGPTSELGITVLRYWWLSWWALCLYLFLAMALFAFFWWIKLRAVIRQKDQEAQQKLRAKDHIVNTVLASVTHELRPTINRIASLTESIPLGTMGEVNPEVANQLIGLHADATGLIHFMDDMQDYSLLMGRPTSLKKGQIVLWHSIEHSFQQIRELTERRNILLKNTVDKKDALVFADEEALRQILKNMISVFAQTGQNGAIEVSFEVAENEMERDRIRIRYQGLPLPNHIMKMDEALFRSEELPQATGLSVALSFALGKQLVMLHGGQVLKAYPHAGDVSFMVCFPTQSLDALMHDSEA